MISVETWEKSEHYSKRQQAIQVPHMNIGNDVVI